MRRLILTLWPQDNRGSDGHVTSARSKPKLSDNKNNAFLNQNILAYRLHLMDKSIHKYNKKTMQSAQ